jgi:flavin-binding protein dodecin
VSTPSWQNAVENAVNEASTTIRNLSGVHVKSYTGKIKDSKIVEYRANVKVSFTVER